MDESVKQCIWIGMVVDHIMLSLDGSIFDWYKIIAHLLLLLLLLLLWRRDEWQYIMIIIIICFEVMLGTLLFFFLKVVVNDTLRNQSNKV